MPADALPEAHRPINQVWSWDRILRSCFIKQADVLQGFYFFPDDFTQGGTRREFRLLRADDGAREQLVALCAQHLGGTPRA